MTANNESYQHVGAQPYTYQQQPNYYQPQQQPQYVYSGAVDSTSAAVTTSGAGYSASYDPVKAKSDEDTALILLIVSFFIGGLILWLIIYFMYKKSPSDKARMYAKIAGILSILSIIPFVLSIVCIIIYVIIVIVAASRH